MSIEVMRQASGALEKLAKGESGVIPVTVLVNDLRAAIADAEKQEPVALETVYETIIQWDEGGGKRSRRELARRIVALYGKQMEQAEPVACVACEGSPQGDNIPCAGCGATPPAAQSAADTQIAAHAKRLALELECLLLSCDDMAAVSKRWQPAHDALQDYRDEVDRIYPPEHATLMGEPVVPKRERS